AYRISLADCCAFIGTAQGRLGHPEEALGSYRRALRTWEELPDSSSRASSVAYNRACVYCRCSTLLNSGRPGPTAGEEVERGRDADRGVDALRQAVAAGFRNGKWIRHDDDLAPLRSRDDFRALLMDLDFPDDLFAP